jgi:hypothetical protein
MLVLFGKIAAAIKIMVKIIPIIMRMAFNISQRK